MNSDEASAPDRLPEDVRALLRDRIESYEELEILLALERMPGAGKTAEELSAAVRVDLPLVERAVRALESRRLIERRSTAPRGTEREPIYVYAPATPALDDTVRALAKAYAEQPIPIIKVMSENAIQRVRTEAARAFSEAFILRKDKNDG